MFSIVVSALFTVLGWVVRSVLIKFVVFFALFFVTTEFVKVLVSSVLPESDGLFSALTMVSPGLAWLMNLMLIPQGLTVMFTALLTRFVIRRIPLIG